VRFRNFSHSASESFRLAADFAARFDDFAEASLVRRLVADAEAFLRDEV
jgi:hypothetical protein